MDPHNNNGRRRRRRERERKKERRSSLAPALAVVAAVQQRKLQGCQQTDTNTRTWKPNSRAHMIVRWHTIDAARGAPALVTDS
jgi:hypothetical protein